MISIIMPAYNCENLIAESIQSALDQDYPHKEIIVCDDGSIDDTIKVVEKFPVKLLKDSAHKGLGGNLSRLVKAARGEYIVILCHDDIFTHESVVSDMVKIFNKYHNVGVVGRYYYQYLNGYPGAVMTIRGDIFVSSCQPSGIGFRKEAIAGEFTNKLFIEVPEMVKRVTAAGWGWRMMEYDTIAARLHPGLKGNAATQPSYYKTDPPESPILNWFSILGEPLCLYTGFIQLKNRAPWLLFDEIKILVKLKPKVLLNPGFWFCVSVAIIVPGCVLRRLSNFYRHRITRHFCKIIERPICES